MSANLLIRPDESHDQESLESLSSAPERKRFAPQIAFVQARLAPERFLGLQLTAGATLLIGASWLFGGIAEDVVSGDHLTVIDVQLTQWFHAHSTAPVTQAMLIFTHLHDPLPVTLYVVVLAVYLAWRRNCTG